MLKNGFFRLSSKDTTETGELSILQFIKKVLNYFNITVADPCCPTTVSPTRYNETTDVIEYYDQVTDTWSSAAAPAWNLTGNAGTNPSTNFIGTTDDVDFRLKRYGDAGYLTRTSTAFGPDSGNYSLESGATPTTTNNTSIGLRAGQSNTGSNITSIGTDAGKTNTGSNNTFVGNSAGVTNTGSLSTFVGNSAGISNTRNNVTCVGYSSGSSNTGFNLTSLGSSSATTNTGSDVTAIGNFTASSNSGNNVIAIGNGAGTLNTKNNVIIIGQNCLTTFADPTAANAALPAPSANGIYLYINQANNYAITARV